MTQYCKEQLRHQQTSSRPMQPKQQVVTKHGDENNTTNISSNTFNHRTTTRPTSRNRLQTNNPSNPTDLRNGPWRTRPHESLMQKKEYSATTAEVTTMTQKHAGSNKTIHRARPTAKQRQVTTQQRHHHH